MSEAIERNLYNQTFGTNIKNVGKTIIKNKKHPDRGTMCEAPSTHVVKPKPVRAREYGSSSQTNVRVRPSRVRVRDKYSGERRIFSTKKTRSKKTIIDNRSPKGGDYRGLKNNH